MGCKYQECYGNLAYADVSSYDDDRDAGLHVYDGGLVIASRAGRAQVLAADIAPKTCSKPESRRHAVLMSLLACACAAALFTGASIYSSARAAHYEAYISSVETTVIIVESGESLWQIALAHPIEGFDTSQTVSVLKSWNGLGSGTLQPGMQLVVPAV